MNEPMEICSEADSANAPAEVEKVRRGKQALN
jgi:hypothetical protein